MRGYRNGSDGSYCAQRTSASRFDVEDIDSQSDPAGFDETVKYDAEMTAHIVDGLFEPAGLLVRVCGHEKGCDAAPFDNSSGVERKARRDWRRRIRRLAGPRSPKLTDAPALRRSRSRGRASGGPTFETTLVANEPDSTTLPSSPHRNDRGPRRHSRVDGRRPSQHRWCHCPLPEPLSITIIDTIRVPS